MTLQRLLEIGVPVLSSYLSWATTFTVCVFLAGKLAKTMLLSLHSNSLWPSGGVCTFSNLQTRLRSSPTHHILHTVYSTHELNMLTAITH